MSDPTKADAYTEEDLRKTQEWLGKVPRRVEGPGTELLYGFVDWELAAFRAEARREASRSMIVDTGLALQLAECESRRKETVAMCAQLRLQLQSEREACEDWIRSEARDCGCSERILRRLRERAK